MAEQQINDLKQKLQQQEAEFERYKAECKELQTFLESQSNKKEEQIRKLKQEAILKEKNFGPLKAQASQLQADNAKYKEQIEQLKVQAGSSKEAAQKNEQYVKEIDGLKKRINQLVEQNEAKQAKIVALQSKVEEASNSKPAKGKSDASSKKLQQALSQSKSRIAELQKQNQKLRQDLAKKHSVKQPKVQEKKVEKEHDNKEEQRLRDKVQKTQKKLAQSQQETTRAEQKNIKLSKQIKELKERLSGVEAEKDGLARKVKQLALANSMKKQKEKQISMKPEQQQQAQSQYNGGDNKESAQATGTGVVYSALVLTKKHYASPFLEFKNDNSIKVYKSTKNGCFQKSLGSLRYRLNQITHNQQQLIEGCVRNIKDNLSNGIKCSIVLIGPKKTTKKYLLASLVAKLRDFILEKIGESEEQAEVVFVKASTDPEKKLELTGHSKEEIEEIFNKITDMAQKSPKKADSKKKPQPKPKARYLKISQGEFYLQIITTSFTTMYLRQSLTTTQALHNIAYSRLPNALQPTDCFRQLLLVLNPIVSLYDECKNTLSIVNCKKGTGQGMGNQDGEFQMRSSPMKEELNQFARRKLQSIEREGQQNQLRIRKQEEQITFYRTKFDQLQLRLKNLLNTHREQNSYLKKSPVTLSYEKMLKFVHSVQAKNPSTSHSPLKAQESYSNLGGDMDENGEEGGQEEYHEEGSVEDIL